jgi:hypothetical protein
MSYGAFCYHLNRLCTKNAPVAKAPAKPENKQAAPITPQRQPGNIIAQVSQNVWDNAYARTLLIHGARAVVSQLFMCRTPYGGGAMYDWLKRLVERRGVNKACVALASKNARIAWKMLIQKTEFQAPLGASA